MAIRVREGQLVLPRTAIVVTGTKDWKPYYKAQLDKKLDQYRARYPNALWITGACVGVDEWAAIHLHLYGAVVYTVVPADRDHVHQQWRKYCSLFEEINPDPAYSGTTRSERYMFRNQRMVDIATPALKPICLAFPDEPETMRSGSWSTVRRARKPGFQVDVTILK